MSEKVISKIKYNHDAFSDYFTLFIYMGREWWKLNTNKNVKNE